MATLDHAKLKGNFPIGDGKNFRVRDNNGRTVYKVSGQSASTRRSAASASPARSRGRTASTASATAARSAGSRARSKSLATSFTRSGLPA